MLLVLWEKDDQPINDIGKTLLLGINTISPLIKRMEAQGLVARHNSDTDKRQQLVYLTPKGKEMKEKAAKIPGYMLDAMNENDVDAEELLKLIPVLDDYIQKLKETE